MVQRRQHERNLFEVLLPDGHKLWPDWLRKIKTLLEDEAVIEVVAQGLEKGWPQSRRRGQFDTLAEVAIRMLILKHLFDWGDDDLEHDVRAHLSLSCLHAHPMRAMCPDARTVLKIVRARSEVIKQIYRQIAEVAKRAGVTQAVDFASTPSS